MGETIAARRGVRARVGERCQACARVPRDANKMRGDVGCRVCDWRGQNEQCRVAADGSRRGEMATGWAGQGRRQADASEGIMRRGAMRRGAEGELKAAGGVLPSCPWSMFPARTCHCTPGPREASLLDYPPSSRPFYSRPRLIFASPCAPSAPHSLPLPSFSLSPRVAQSPPGRCTR